MKKHYLFILNLIILISNVSCAYKFNGKNKELYTEAVNSLLWNMGKSSGADRFINPDIVVLEKDNYGRIMYQYTEAGFSNLASFTSVLISQYSDENYVYYYEDINFISKEIINDNQVFESIEADKIKTLNDWNLPLDKSKCIKKKLINAKGKNKVSDKKLNSIYSDYMNNYYRNSTYLLTSDSAGNTIYYSWVYSENAEIMKQIILYYKTDGDYKIYEPEKIYNYQEELKKIKEDNGWKI